MRSSYWERTHREICEGFQQVIFGEKDAGTAKQRLKPGNTRRKAIRCDDSMAMMKHGSPEQVYELFKMFRSLVEKDHGQKKGEEEESELDALLSLLKESKKPFESIAQSFYKSFPKSEQFKVGCVICMLLQDKLLTQTQRLVGFYLLYDIYRNETSLPTTPFVPIVLETVEQTTDLVERKFLLQFLTSLPKELPKQTVNNFLAGYDPSEVLTIPDLDAFRRMHQEGAPKISNKAALGIRPTVRDNDLFWVSQAEGEDEEGAVGHDC